jgi:hypothetical protein
LAKKFEKGHRRHETRSREENGASEEREGGGTVWEQSRSREFLNLIRILEIDYSLNHGL